jgi:hypothetical protein
MERARRVSTDSSYQRRGHSGQLMGLMAVLAMWRGEQPGGPIIKCSIAIVRGAKG